MPAGVVIAGAGGPVGRLLKQTFAVTGAVATLSRGVSKDGRPGAVPKDGRPGAVEEHGRSGAVPKDGRLRRYLWNPEQGHVSAEGRAALAASDLWIHLAGESVSAGRLDAEHQRRLVESRVAALRTLIGEWRQLGRPAVHLMVASAMGFYGNTGDLSVDEAASAGRTRLARVCEVHEAEARAVAAEFAAAGARLSMLRIGVVLHPGAPALDQLLGPIRLGFGGPLGDGSTWWPWISGRDLARAVRHIAEHVSDPVADGFAVWNLCAPGSATQAEIGRALAVALRRPWWLPVPAWVLRLGLGALANEMLFTPCRGVPAHLLETGFAFQDAAMTEATARELVHGPF